MKTQTLFLGTTFGLMLLAAGMVLADGRSGSQDDANYCMDVSIEPFHMMPGYADDAGACAVRDYWDGELQEAFYPFTREDHLFNCDVFGEEVPLLPDVDVPSSVVSQGDIVGKIGGHDFSARLYCASLTNWYQDSCADPDDLSTCSVQLAQPMLARGLPFPRVTEVSVFDGRIVVDKRNRRVEVPVLLVTRAAGITHLEDLSSVPPQVGASVTHSSLGMLTYEEHDGVKVLKGSLDLLLQGHIFSPKSVAEDPGAAVIKGSVCSKDLYTLLNRKGKRGGKGRKSGYHDD